MFSSTFALGSTDNNDEDEDEDNNPTAEATPTPPAAADDDDPPSAETSADVQSDSVEPAIRAKTSEYVC